MRLLFVKLKHIGDALLLTPTLAAVRTAHPSAEIHVVVRRGTEGILAGCAAIDRVHTSMPPETSRRGAWNWLGELGLARDLRRVGFDWAFELGDGDRGRALCWLSGATNRCANVAWRPLNWWWRTKFTHLSTFDWTHGRHQVEKDFHTVHDVLPLAGGIPPLQFARGRAASCELRARLASYAVLHPGTRWIRKRWPAEKWLGLCRHLLTRVDQLVISAGPDPEEINQAAKIAAPFESRVFVTGGQLTWAQLAGLLFDARLFVGVDTAAMHLAAACQCPTVAIWGPSSVEQWSPWQVRHRLVESPDDAGAGPERKFAKHVDEPAVARACDELLGGSP